MTVLQGARPMAVGKARLLPRLDAGPRYGARPIGATRRRRLTSPARARGRSQPFGAVIALVLVALLVGLIYVAQAVRLGATNYEIDTLIAARVDLARQVQTIETSVLRWGTESTVIERAQRIGLDQVATRVRLPAR